MPLYFGETGLKRERGLKSWGDAPLRQIATGSEVQSIGQLTTISNQEKYTHRHPHYLGKEGATEIRFVYTGYTMQAVSGEVDLGNAVTIGAALEIPTAPNATKTVRFAFAGSAFGVMPNGAVEFISDPLYPTDFGYVGRFPPDLMFWERSEMTVAVGEKLPAPVLGYAPAVTGMTTVAFPAAAATQLDAAGTLTATGGANKSGTVIGATLVIGRTAAPQVSHAQVGDSIITRVNDTNGDGVNGGGGFFRRGLANVGGFKMPWAGLSVPGESSDNWGTKRAQLFKYFTHVTINYAANDLRLSLGTPAHINANNLAIAASAKAAGVRHVEYILPIPYTTSTDWTTLVGQSYFGGDPIYGVGGARDQLITLALASVGAGGFDAVLDINTGGCADATEPRKWVVDGSANYATLDGLHPNSAQHGRLAPIVTARAATWTA